MVRWCGVEDLARWIAGSSSKVRWWLVVALCSAAEGLPPVLPALRRRFRERFLVRRSMARVFRTDLFGEWPLPLTRLRARGTWMERVNPTGIVSLIPSA